MKTNPSVSTWIEIGFACSVWLLGCASDVRLATQIDASNDSHGTAGAAGASTSSGAGGSGGGGGALCTSDWGHVLGGPGSQFGRSVAVGSAGEVVTSIELYDTSVGFDGEPWFDDAAGGHVIAKLDAAGAPVWARAIGGPYGQDQVMPVAIDADGNVIVAGNYFQSIDIGGALVASAPGSAMFVAKLSADGAPIWLRSFPSTHYGYGLAGLRTDAQGNVLFVSDLGGDTLDFDGKTISGDLMIAKLAPGGEPLWARAYPGVMLEAGTFEVKSNGHAVVGGSLFGEADLGGGTLTTKGGFDLLVAEIDGEGHHVWSKRFGDGGLQRMSALTLDAAGAIFLAGTFDADVDLGGGSLGSKIGWGSFVAKLDATGHHVWSKPVSAEVASITGLGRLPGGGVVVAGIDGASVVDAGCGPVSNVASKGTFLATLDAHGTCLTQRGLGKGPYQVIGNIGAGPLGHVAAAGYFQSSIDVGNGVVEAELNDGFVMVVAPPCEP